MTEGDNFSKSILSSKIYRRFTQGVAAAKSLGDLQSAFAHASIETIGASGVLLFPLYRGAVPTPGVVAHSAYFAKETVGQKIIEALPRVDRELGSNGSGSIETFLTMKKKARNFVEHYGRRFLEKTWTYNIFFRSMKADQALVSVLGSPQFPLGFFGLTRTDDESPFTARDLTVADLMRTTLEKELYRIARMSANDPSLNQLLYILSGIIPEPCAVLDKGGHPIWANHAAEELLGGDLWSIADSCFVFSENAVVERWKTAIRRFIAPDGSIKDPDDHVLVNQIDREGTEPIFFVLDSGAERAPRSQWDVLSTREQEIARYAAQGYSTVNIGAILSISVGTVRNHLKNIYRKLHISSRVELALHLRD